MLHEWLNALHVIAGVLWIGGMMGMAMVFAVSGKSAANDASRAALLDYVRKWNRCVTSPAMLLLWIAGIWMIVSYGKFPHAWLLIKMDVMVLLSAIHGMLSGELRRRATGQSVGLDGEGCETLAAIGGGGGQGELAPGRE